MEHPSVAEQEEAMARALSKVTRPALEALLLRSGYELLAYELRPENHPDVPGRLFNNNAIYMLQARRAQGAEDLVLRILNCHAWRRGRNGTSEVGVLKWLEQQRMPKVPRIVDFATDASSSPLGCEFILMEKLPGRQLRELWPSLSETERMGYVSQLEAWVARLHAVPAPAGLEEGPIASLRLAESGEVRADRPLVIVDGPTLPESSRKSFYALGEAILKDALERLADSPLRRALLEVHGCFEMSAKRAEANEATCLCHNDLNLGNVLADEGEISGVVDWEGAGFTFKDQDLEDLREMGGSQLPDAKRLRLMELLREVPCLYYFNATWFGALNDFEGREKASLEEGRNAEKAVWQWLETHKNMEI